MPSSDADDGVPKRRPGVAQRVVRRRIQAAERRRKQPDRRAREDGPHVHRVRAAESAGLKQRRGDDIAERQKRHRRRDDKERDLPQARLETAPQPSVTAGSIWRSMTADADSADSAGSSAADTDMPNRLIGSVYRSCAFISPATAPVGSRLASRVSTYALICTTPRLKNTGTKLRTTSRTCVRDVRRAQRRALRSHDAGRRAQHRRQLHDKLQRAANDRSPAPESPPGEAAACRLPKMTSVAIIAAFHITGAVYESRKRRWLLSTPRHHADSTSSPAPGNRMRTSRIVSVALFAVEARAR